MNWTLKIEEACDNNNIPPKFLQVNYKEDIRKILLMNIHLRK
jgi:hypothetical protein